MALSALLIDAPATRAALTLLAPKFTGLSVNPRVTKEYFFFWPGNFPIIEDKLHWPGISDLIAGQMFMKFGVYEYKNAAVRVSEQQAQSLYSKTQVIWLKYNAYHLCVNMSFVKIGSVKSTLYLTS